MSPGGGAWAREKEMNMLDLTDMIVLILLVAIIFRDEK